MKTVDIKKIKYLMPGDCYHDDEEYEIFDQAPRYDEYGNTVEAENAGCYYLYGHVVDSEDEDDNEDDDKHLAMFDQYGNEIHNDDDFDYYGFFGVPDGDEEALDYAMECMWGD